jgi:alkanesulfonate monooxygenase
MPIEFLGRSATNDRSETRAPFGSVIDRDYAPYLAQAHEGTGRDRVPFGHFSMSPDGAQVAPHIDRPFAHRPDVTSPSHTARAPAILDQPGDGRLTPNDAVETGRHEILVACGKVAPRDRGRGALAFVR